MASLHIIVIGAGLGGLGVAIALKQHGHKVTVLESAPGLNEVGAGIQVPPSSARILESYGALPELLENGMVPTAINFLRYATGEVVGSTPLDSEMTERYGFP